LSSPKFFETCERLYEATQEYEIPTPAGGGSFNPNLLEQNISSESQHRQVVGRSGPTYCRLGLNDPPPAGVGILEFSFSFVGWD
jgi:hypothetical protein